MATPSITDRLRPQWMRSAADIARTGGLVRSVCLLCGTPLRVDATELIARHGLGVPLIDRTERCRMVGCTGTAIYLVARSYGRPWTPLVEDPDLEAAWTRISSTSPLAALSPLS